MASGTIHRVFTTGTDGIWNYRKYDDGTYHAWLDSAVNLVAGTAWAGGAYHLSSSALNPPSFSTSVTSMNGAARSGVLAIFCGWDATTNKTFWFNGGTTAVNNVAVHLDMYGTW